MKKKTGQKHRFRGRYFAWISGLLAGLICLLFLSSLAGLRYYIVLSGSMEPKIHTGSLCFVDTRAKFEEIKEGDIVTYRSGLGVLVTHRAVRVLENGIETKGDANDVSDGISVTEKNFVGRAFFSIPYIGYGCYFLQKLLFQVFA